MEGGTANERNRPDQLDRSDCAVGILVLVGYSSLRMSGKSKSEAATRAGLVFAATLVLILIAAWAFSMPDPDFIGLALGLRL